MPCYIQNSYYILNQYNSIFLNIPCKQKINLNIYDLEHSKTRLILFNELIINEHKQLKINIYIK